MYPYGGRMGIGRIIGRVTVAGAVGLGCTVNDVVATAPDGGNDAATDSPSDASADTPIAPCALEKPFEAPTPFDAVNSDADDLSVRFSADGSRAYFSSNRAGLDFDIYVASKAGGYADGVRLAGVNSTPWFQSEPSVSADEREIFFTSLDPLGDAGQAAHVWRASRAQPILDFSGRSAIALGGTTTGSPFLAADGNTLFFSDFANIKSATRISGAQFGAPTVELQGGTAPVLSADALTMYFRKGKGIWVTHRTSASASWEAGTAVTELDPDADADAGAGVGDTPSDLSPDGCTLYFTSDRPSSKAKNNIWLAKKPAN